MPRSYQAVTRTCNCGAAPLAVTLTVTAGEVPTMPRTSKALAVGASVPAGTLAQL